MKMQIMLEPGARFESPANPSDAGFDIYSPYDIPMYPGFSALVRTGIRIALPEGYYGRVSSRSGNAVNKNIEVGAGVIDNGYTGELQVLLYNHSKMFQTLPKNKAIAQLIVSPYYVPELEVVDELAPTVRGDKGFGSSDAKSP